MRKLSYTSQHDPSPEFSRDNREHNHDPAISEAKPTKPTNNTTKSQQTNNSLKQPRRKTTQNKGWSRNQGDAGREEERRESRDQRYHHICTGTATRRRRSRN
ncbi:hypothetical protein ISN44_As08g037010 [Arabidopsis suecica]|uniref:Uncharacterized protein n=1 Tax=Arabidopsis suecica TaxID=45249 RepID=A0A8T2BCH9_ARASU|nr:hypothetical protein ISN44_As08g037010 [Arabidopsis suecica]